MREHSFYQMKHLHPLYGSIDRSLAVGKYVLVDPLDDSSIIYLSPKEYKNLLKTWLSSETSIEVLHNPFNKGDIASLMNENSDTASSNNNPLLKGVKVLMTGRSKLLSVLSKRWDVHKMISLTNFNELGLVKSFLRIVIPLSLARPIKDVSSKIWLALRFIKYIENMNKKHGSSYVVNYLKLSQLAISRSISRKALSSLQELDPSRHYRRLTRTGLPTFIPTRDRRAILSGSDRVIRFWLTLYGLYRIVKSPALPKLNTITDPLVADNKFMNELMTFFANKAYDILSHYFSNIDLNITNWWNPETSSGISTTSWRSLYQTMYYMEKHEPLMFMYIKEWLSETQEEFVSVATSLLPSYYLLVKELQTWTARAIQKVELPEGIRFTINNKIELLNVTRKFPNLGYLSTKAEPAGKVRVFAMVDVLTQNIMRPLHIFLSNILKALPNDGTFNQEAMVDRARIKSAKYGGSYCYDLSAATDRLPILLQEAILSSLIGANLAQLWKRILIGRSYFLPRNKSSAQLFKNTPAALDREYYYSVGQPMGALSSFNMLGITHHLIVQYCYHCIKNEINNFNIDLIDNNTGWCIAYEILGDDVAIFHKPLADKYLEVMSLIGVPINERKSVIDQTGKTVELAKRTIHLGKDVSAISFKDMLTSAPFIQRSAIASRVSSRGILPVNLATQILTSFWGENPLLRKSFMEISYFFKFFEKGAISQRDLFFFLFLIKKISKTKGNPEFNLSSQMRSILGNVIAELTYNNVTSESSSSGSVFSNALWKQHIVEFNISILSLVPTAYKEMQNWKNYFTFERIDLFCELFATTMLDYNAYLTKEINTLPFYLTDWYESEEGSSFLHAMNNSGRIEAFLEKVHASMKQLKTFMLDKLFFNVDEILAKNEPTFPFRPNHEWYSLDETLFFPDLMFDKKGVNLDHIFSTFLNCVNEHELIVPLLSLPIREVPDHDLSKFNPLTKFYKLSNLYMRHLNDETDKEKDLLFGGSIATMEQTMKDLDIIFSLINFK